MKLKILTIHFSLFYLVNVEHRVLVPMVYLWLETTVSFTEEIHQ